MFIKKKTLNLWRSAYKLNSKIREVHPRMKEFMLDTLTAIIGNCGAYALGVLKDLICLLIDWGAAQAKITKKKKTC